MQRLKVVTLVAACFLLLVQFVSTASWADSKNEIKDIRVFSSKQYTRVVIDLLKTPVYREGAIPEAYKIYFDLKDAVLRATSVKSKDVSNAVLKKIRIGQFDQDTVRIVFDLDNNTRQRVFTLTDPNRIIIDIFADKEKVDPPPVEAKSNTEEPAPKKDKDHNVAVAKTEVKTEEKTKTEPEVDVAKVEEKVKAELKSKLEEKSKKSDKVKATVQKHPDKSKTASKNKGKKGKDSDIVVREIEKKVETELFARKKIVIDPGHGGHDTGAIGVTGLLEKDVVLDVAKMVSAILRDKYMYDVYLTRDDDTFISLDERAAIANGKNADLFVSIHGNANNSPSVRGLETYFLNFSNSEEAMKVAARENDISVKRMKEVQSELGLILASLARETKRDESLRLAHYVQSSMYSYLRKKHKDIVDHGVRQALFYVLVGANMPSALVEISYLTNADEEKRLKTDQYKEEIASSVAAGINKYLTSLPGTPEFAKAAGAKKRLN
ncbi:N-acetylmuramoyl-L-alanine amidase [Candidatus Magnetomonas plexicatena]|uniref:N-acetylmuramoyl-L-alanine amidase n=1 Tax=Candidatus Magnetomonas plexicatena TaxID=2552947 RepID=UPI001C76283D|nr:AMIN domain-containing protein [Nitrospirales bacterium LBB_01]